MALTPRLDQRQSQTLVMTPQLQQAIKLLQLSNLELAEYLEQELERNPLLERDESDREGGAEPEASSDPGQSESESAAAEDWGTLATDRLDGAEGTSQASDALDAEVDNVWQDEGAPGPDAGPTLPGLAGAGGGRGFEDPGPGFEDSMTRPESLRDHLLAQLGVELHDPVDRVIGMHLIEMLDESGYLVGDLDQLAGRLGCPRERVDGTLARVQGFDPVGIFARNLKECLALQLKERDRLDPAMQALLDNLELVAKRDLDGLKRACGVDAEDIADMVAELRALDPKPALAFDSGPATPIVPDVLMRSQPGGGWIIELNSESLPRVLVNNQYYARINRAARSKEERQYIAEQHQTASWLVKSLHQRATTILRVATEIVRQQEGFFAKGVSHLKPLVLRDIADAIEMHESTVSRVTSNKYIATPRGIYELKYFFSAAIAAAGGGQSHSAEAVRHRIRCLIDAELPDQVLSDDRIVDILRAEGIDIARRTVAKYRESMGISSSVQRRREKTSALAAAF